jgi:hypothetical protein
MSVSAAGLLYHFDQTQDYSSYKKVRAGLTAEG